MRDVTALGKADVAVQVPSCRSIGSDGFEHLVWPYKLALPSMVAIAVYVSVKRLFYRSVLGREPSTNFWLVDGVSRNSRRVKDGQARSPALDATYNFTEGEGRNVVVRFIDGFWLNVLNAQAVRNRLKIAKRELRKAILERAATTKDGIVEILSLAAGSAQAVIEVLDELQNERPSKLGNAKVRAFLVDNDDAALRHARELSEQHGVSDHVEITPGDVLFFERTLKGRERAPDIIEMMGLMDYLRDTIAVLLIKKISCALSPDGIFLTCHIHPNPESFFLRKVVNWGMIHRSLDKFTDLLADGGFISCELYTEPHGIHTVAVGCKS